MKRGFLNKTKTNKTAAPEPKAISPVAKDKLQLPTLNALEEKSVEASSSIKQGSSLNNAAARKASPISTAEGRTTAGSRDSDKFLETFAGLPGFEEMSAHLSRLGISLEQLAQPGNRLDYDANQFMMTTLSFSSDPDDVIESILRDTTKGKIYWTPGFPLALPQLPSSTPRHRIGSSPFGGKGMFATRSLHTGDIIMYERPLIVSPSGIPLPPPSQFPSHFTSQQIMQASQKKWENYVDILFNRMTPANQQRFLALENSVEDVGRIKGILATNGYGITKFFDGNGEVEGNSYAAVCNEMSRVNHSCGPNITKIFDVASFSFALVAVRTIEEGEELTTSYCDVTFSKAKRQKFLDGYGFDCTCPYCLNATPRTDHLRQNLSSLVDRRFDDVKSWRQKGGPRRQDAPLTAALELLAEIETEGLQCSIAFITLVFIIANIYRELNDKPNAAKYAKFAGDLAVAHDEFTEDIMQKWLVHYI